MLNKLNKYKIWNIKYSRPYYKFNNKIFHSKFDLYEYLKINQIKLNYKRFFLGRFFYSCNKIIYTKTTIKFY